MNELFAFEGLLRKLQVGRIVAKDLGPLLDELRADRSEGREQARAGYGLDESALPVGS